MYNKIIRYSESRSEPCQTSTMELLAKVVNAQPLFIFIIFYHFYLCHYLYHFLNTNSLYMMK